MKELVKAIAIVCLTLVVLVIISTIEFIVSNNQTEQIKILEQSLNEQIQEKKVYMNLLEGEESE